MAKSPEVQHLEKAVIIARRVMDHQPITEPEPTDEESDTVQYRDSPP